MTEASFYKSDLAPALAKAVMFSAPKSPNYILQSVRIVCSGGTATITGTDLTASVDLTCPCSGDNMTAVIDAQSASRFVNKAGDAVTLKLEDGHAKLSSGRFRVSIPSREAGDFPLTAQNSEGHADVDIALLRYAIDRLSCSMSSEQTRYYLCGISVISDSDGCRLASTDGGILGKVDMPSWGEIEDAIIPRETIARICKVLPKDGDVKISASESSMWFEFDGGVLRTQLVDGRYPDYTRLLRDSNPRIRLDAEELVSAIDRMSIIGEVNSVAFDPAEGGFELSAKNQSGREANDFIAADIDGDVARFGFNPRYIAPILATFDGAVDIDMQDAIQSFIFTSPAQPDRVSLVMPIKV